MAENEGKTATEEKKGKRGKDTGKEKTSQLQAEGKPLRTPTSRLRKQYLEEIIPAMMAEFGFKNRHQVPAIEKVVINLGVGEGSRDIKVLESAMKDLTVITGQKPMMSRARKSVAQYKLREGMPVGTFVTLRGNRMYEFLDRLFNLALPRVRDFQGLNPNAFDGTGNYTFGIQEQLVFPEIDYDDIDRVRGMDITIVTTAKNDVHAQALLRNLGCPFRTKGS